MSLVVAIAIVGQATAAAPMSTPHDDPFYTPPGLHKNARPGTVIRSRSISVTAPTPASAWQMLYRSTTAQKKPVAVSGTVFVPDAPWTGGGRRPVVTLSPGTQGLADSCAPSYLFATGAEYESAQVDQALAQGWAVAVTDYQGLGTPGKHPYAVGRAEGPDVLDAARAAMRVKDTGLKQGSPVGIFGYSQGGGGAVWAAEMQPRYAPNMNLKGVAAGGVPANLAKVARFLDGSPNAGLLFAATAGLPAAYPGVLKGLLTQKGRALIKQVRTECVGDLTTKYSGEHIADYSKVPHPLANRQVKKRITQNKAGQHTPQVPILMYHAGSDDIVPIGQAKALFDTYCAHGATAHWMVYPGLNHAAGIFAGTPAAVSYLGDRFNGAAAPNDC